MNLYLRDICCHKYPIAANYALIETRCIKAEDRSKRRETKKIERLKSFTYDELIARDKTNLDIFWLKDESLEDTENLPAPEVLAQEIVEQLEAALEEFRSVEEVLAGADDSES